MDLMDHFREHMPREYQDMEDRALMNSMGFLGNPWESEDYDLEARRRRSPRTGRFVRAEYGNGMNGMNEGMNYGSMHYPMHMPDMRQAGGGNTGMQLVPGLAQTNAYGEQMRQGSQGTGGSSGGNSGGQGGQSGTSGGSSGGSGGSGTSGSNT